MNTKVRTGPVIFGQCQTARLIEEGKVNSTVSAQGWHDLCRGATVGRNARVTACECDCHEGQVRCTDCGLVTLEADVVGADNRCVDREACSGRLQARLDANPAMAGIRARRAETTRKEASRGPSKPKTGRCEHCGAPTSGGRFAMGHDAKLKYGLQGNLKGWLKGHFDGELGGLEDDATELYTRNWMPPEVESRLPEGFVAKAKSKVSTEFVAARNRARMEGERG